MQSQSRFFDDLAQLMTSAMGAAQGVRQEAEELLKSRLEGLLGDYDLVSREDFDVIRDMVVRTREENERLKAQITDLQFQMEALKKDLTALNTDTALPNKPSHDTEQTGSRPSASISRSMLRQRATAFSRKGPYRAKRSNPQKKRY